MAVATVAPNPHPCLSLAAHDKVSKGLILRDLSGILAFASHRCGVLGFFDGAVALGGVRSARGMRVPSNGDNRPE